MNVLRSLRESRTVRLGLGLLSSKNVRRALAVGVLALAAVLGYRTSIMWLGLIGLVMGTVVLLEYPRVVALAIVPAALYFPFEFGTGTAVALNAATVLIPVLMAVWLLDALRRRSLRIVPSRVHRPLFLFVGAGLFSLGVGNATWDPAVPRSGSFILAQIAQWALFGFSAGAFLLPANLLRDRAWLQRLTFSYLAFAGIAAFLFVAGGGAQIVHQWPLTVALIRAPFWLLLAAVAVGQLLFNDTLSTGWRLFLSAVFGAVVIAVFLLERETASHWVGVATVCAALAWLRWRRWRWLAVLILVVLLLTGFLSSYIYDFAGGEEEWNVSGGSRLVLIERVIKVSLRNPITGIGPAAYRPYARIEPLFYRGAYWVDPLVSSHNNYVDLFSHVGLLGLGLFLWFAIEVILLALRLRKHYTSGFAAGYVNGMLATWVGSLVLMMLADWILPFVYNIGFPGFQASVLVWLFLGGLVALEHLPESEGTQSCCGESS